MEANLCGRWRAGPLGDVDLVPLAVEEGDVAVVGAGFVNGELQAVSCFEDCVRLVAQWGGLLEEHHRLVVVVLS